MSKNEPVPGKIYRLTGEANDPCIAAGNDREECVVDPVKENIHKLIENINEQDGESFRVVWFKEWDETFTARELCTLYRGSEKILEGGDPDIETRLRKIQIHNRGLRQCATMLLAHSLRESDGRLLTAFKAAYQEAADNGEKVFIFNGWGEIFTADAKCMIQDLEESS